MTDKKPNAWAVQFKLDDDWLTQTWHREKKTAIAELENDKHYFGDTIRYRIIETVFNWPNDWIKRAPL
jgi:hypothetical protein